MTALLSPSIWQQEQQQIEQQQQPLQQPLRQPLRQPPRQRLHYGRGRTYGIMDQKFDKDIAARRESVVPAEAASRYL